MMDWRSVNPDIVEIFTRLSIIGIIVPAIFLYFSYAFPDGKNISIKKVILIFLPLLPFILLSWTNLNVESIDTSTSDCESVLGSLYYLIPVIFILYCVWAGVVLVKKFRRGDDQVKKQIKLVLVGFVFFIAWATVTNVIAPLIGFDNLSFFGPIGVMIFMSFVAYAIIKYQFLSIKVLLTQALVIGLIMIAGSELLFAESATNQILILITLAAIIGFGYMLIKSVKLEVKQREEVEAANKTIERKNSQLEVANKEITEKKEHLEIANKEISKRGEELQKINNELKIAYDKLEELDQAKEEFTSLASHQLKNAPTAIKSLLAMFLDGDYGKVPDNQLEVLKNINKANEHQIELSKELLQIIKMESKKVKLDFQKERVEDICQNVYNNLAAMATERNLEIKYERPEQPLPELLLDKSKVFDSIVIPHLKI